MALLQDVRHTFRSWRRDPVAALVLISVLSLGIGANAAIFAVVDGILFRPLPYRAADRLTIIWETNPGQAVRREGPSGSDFVDWREQNQSFEDLAAIEVGSATITGQGEPEQIPGLRVTANLFDVFGAKPFLGRLFGKPEMDGGRRPVVVLSYGFWQRRFAGDPAVLGKQVNADGLMYTVIGVLAPDFYSIVPADAYVPYPLDELKQKPRQAHELGVIGRLKPGVTAEQANAEMDAIARRIQERHPEVRGWLTTVVPMQKALTESVRTSLLVLFAAVGFVLLLVCANVANLTLARSVGRRREIAVREALGASTGRLCRQLITESVVTAVAAGLLGLLVAVWGLQGLQAILPNVVSIPDAAAEVSIPSLSVDWNVAAFTVAISVVAGLLFGAAPTLALLRGSTAEQLKQGAKGSAGGTRRMRYILLATEIALAQVLLVGAGLTLRSFYELQKVNPGFQSARLLTMEMELPTDSRYKTDIEQSQVFQKILESVRAVPGVQTAGLTSVLPLGHEDERARFLIENAEPLSPGERLNTDARRISTGYLEAMRVPLVQGRYFEDRDRREAPRVAIVDEAFARRFFQSGPVIGRRLLFRKGVPVEIVGVVKSVRHEAVARAAVPTVYVPIAQVAAARMTMAIRSTRDPLSMVNELKQAVWRVDSGQPVFRVRLMDDVVSAANGPARILTMVLSGFAGVAVLLAAIGVFGIVAYMVTQRTREMGIRIALGARSADVLGMVLKESLSVAGVGIAAGLAGALAAGRVLAGELYGVRPFEPGLLIALALLLGVIALLASFWPARRAARVDPIVALREE